MYKADPEVTAQKTERYIFPSEEYQELEMPTLFDDPDLFDPEESEEE